MPNFTQHTRAHSSEIISIDGEAVEEETQHSCDYCGSATPTANYCEECDDPENDLGPYDDFYDQENFEAFARRVEGK